MTEPITASRERIEEEFEKLEALDRYNLRFNGYLEKFLLQHEAVVREEVARKIEKLEPEDPEAYGWHVHFGEERCCPGDDIGEGYIRGLKDAVRAIRTTQPTI